MDALAEIARRTGYLRHEAMWLQTASIQLQRANVKGEGTYAV